MQRVRLLGELGELFGAEFIYYNLRRPADAIKMLCINRPAFKDYLLNAEENGIAFQVIQANVDMAFEDLLLPFGSNDLVIAPVISGSGGPVGRIITGVALVVASIVLAPVGGGFLGLGAGALTGAGFTLGAAASVAIGAIGASLALGGVAQLISPQPQIPLSIGSIGGAGGGAIGGGSFAGGGARFGSRNRTNGPTSVNRGLDGQQSYAYTGAVNTVGVGATVPLAYGKVLIGSHLLRSKVQVTDETDPMLLYIKKPGVNTMLVGGESFSTEFDDVSGAVIKKVEPPKASFTSPNENQQNPKTSIKLDGNSNETEVEVRRDETYKDEFDVVFEFSNGLYSFVSGTDTTKVDAFVTYEVSVYKTAGEPTAVNLIAVDTVTVQGLLDNSASNKFQYMHKIELPTWDTNWSTVVVKIIDTDAEPNLDMTLFAAGHQLS